MRVSILASVIFFNLLANASAQKPTPPRFETLGTLSADVSKASPVVFLDTLYRLECLPANTSLNPSPVPHLRLVNLDTAEKSAPFAKGYHLASAFATEEKLYVFCVTQSATAEITAFWSTDAATWSSKPVLRLEGWEVSGASVCYEKERFLMALEVAEPLAAAATPTVIRFAESKDLINWHLIGASYTPSKKRARLSPKLIFDDIYYYLFFSQLRSTGKTETWIARSTDLVGWAQARRNPVYAPGDSDRRLREGIAPDGLDDRKTATNLVNMNLDLCSHRGRVIMYYSWGDPNARLFLGEAVYRGYLRDWLVPYFRKSGE